MTSRLGRLASVAIASTTAVVVALGLTATDAQANTYSEQQGSRGSNTFTNPHNASGMGQRVGAGTWVDVSCKFYDPTIPSVNPDGYWYRLASAPWNDAYYAPANTFMNGDPWGGSFTHNTDLNVPDCGAAPAPAPAPVVTLAQGPAASTGYRYAVTLSHFNVDSSVTVTCYDSVSPNGFYTFTLPTDNNGYASSAAYCYSGDGPDHWVQAGGVESNRVTWTVQAPVPPPTPAPPVQPPPPQPPVVTPPRETCPTVSGVVGPSSHVSEWLISRFERGYTTDVVIPWSYFSGNPQFVQRAKQLRPDTYVVGWRAVRPSDMFFALGHFTIYRASEHCYQIVDTYDFDPTQLPFWLQQIVHSAVPFKVRSAGWLD